MATFFERMAEAARAAMDAWRGLSPLPQLDYYDGLPYAERERVERCQKFWDYYHGRHKTQLKRAEGLSDDNLILNYSRRIVDKGVSFLFGKPVEFQIVGGEETDAERALKRIWVNEDWRGAFLNEVGLNGAVCGSFFIQIVPTEDGPPRLLNLNPMSVFPVYSQTDIEDVLAYELRYRLDNALRRQVWAMSEDRMTWQFWTEERKRNSWIPAPMPVMNEFGQRDVVTGRQVWPFPWCPIVHGKNLPNPNNFYGLSDLEDADINDAINFVGSNTNRILKLYAHPVIWGNNLGNKILDWSPGKTLDLGMTGEMHALEMSPDMTASQNHLRALVKAFHEITRVPENDPDSLKLGSMSGFALRILYSDLIEKTETKRRLYGRALAQVCQYGLELMGFPPQKVTLHWRDPLPIDERAQMEQDRFDLDYALASRETVRSRRGLDQDIETRRIAAESAETGGGAFLSEFLEIGRAEQES